MKPYKVILLRVFVLLITLVSLSQIGTTNLDVSSILDIIKPVIEFHY